MAFKIIDLNENKSSNDIGILKRTVGGGLKRASDFATNAVRATANPHEFSQGIISNVLGAGPQQNYVKSPEIPSFKPKGWGENLAQNIISGIATSGATGGLNPIGTTALQKAGSFAKNVGNVASDVAASEVGGSIGGALGGPLGEVVGSSLGVGLKRGSNPKRIKEHFKPIEKDLYKKVKAEGATQLASGELNELAHQFIKDEQRRTSGKSPYIRRLANWMQETKDGTIKAEDLHNFKKDLNQYIYREYNSPDYLKALEREVHQTVKKAGESPRTATNLTAPSWTKNLRKADLLHKTLVEPKDTNNPIAKVWNFLFRKFSPGKFLLDHSGRRLTTPAKLGWALPSETTKYFGDQILKAIEKNPAIFQTEIKAINKELDKKEPSKKGFKIINIS